MLGLPECLRWYRRPLRRSGLRHMSPALASHHELASLGVIGRDWVRCATGGAHRVARRCGRATARALVGHKRVLDDDAEGVRTFFGFEH